MTSVVSQAGRACRARGRPEPEVAGGAAAADAAAGHRPQADAQRGEKNHEMRIMISHSGNISPIGV